MKNHLANAPISDNQNCSTTWSERRRPIPVSHYPTALIDVWRLRDGSRITLRPVLPQDSILLGNLMSRLSPSARRNRFHGAVNKVPAQWLDKMTCVDHERHVAFVMTTTHDSHERIIADARYFVNREGPGDSAEFAVVVDESWQRLGLGTRAMHALARTAADAGLRWLQGDVLANNRSMLALMRKCNFCCTPNLHEDGLVIAQTSLSTESGHADSTLGARLRRWLPWQYSGHPSRKDQQTGSLYAE